MDIDEVKFITLPQLTEEKRPTDEEWFNILFLDPYENMDALARLGLKLLIKEGSLPRNLHYGIFKPAIMKCHSILFEVGILALHHFAGKNVYSDEDLEYWIAMCRHYKKGAIERHQVRYDDWINKLLNILTAEFYFCNNCDEAFSRCFCLWDYQGRKSNKVMTPLDW
jgi:hypothetical protein